MTTMIERVARAIDPYAWSDKTMGMRRAVSMNTARAAVEAMRELSEAMVAAGSDEMTNGKQTWTAMIDAALKEHA